MPGRGRRDAVLPVCEWDEPARTVRRRLPAGCSGDGRGEWDHHLGGDAERDGESAGCLSERFVRVRHDDRLRSEHGGAEARADQCRDTVHGAARGPPRRDHDPLPGRGRERLREARRRRPDADDKPAGTRGPSPGSGCTSVCAVDLLEERTERGGFEPPNEVNPRYAISSRARSTAPAPLLGGVREAYRCVLRSDLPRTVAQERHLGSVPGRPGDRHLARPDHEVNVDL